MSVQIELDKLRTVKFPLRSIRDLEAAMDGLPLSVIVHRIYQGGVTAIVTALWAGLKHEDQALTLTRTEKILEAYFNEHSVETVSKALNDALLESGILKNIKTEDHEDAEGNALPVVVP